MNNLKFIRALGVFIFLSACIHILVILIKFFQTLNWKIVNYFSILEFDAFWPVLSDGVLMHVIATVFAVLIYAIVLFIVSKERL